jgi:hypothetical protein
VALITWPEFTFPADAEGENDGIAAGGGALAPMSAIKMICGDELFTVHDPE